MTVLLGSIVAVVVSCGVLELLRRSPREQRERLRADRAREWAAAERDLLIRGASPEKLAELREEILGP